MKPDKTTKVLLGLIALGLWLNAMAPLWHKARAVKASERFTCDGKLKVNVWGATEPMIGGYDVDVTCHE